MINQPLISIITVVYNGEEHLEETIQSVINQSYKNIEYIIIDGGSTDGTVDIIKKYEDKIAYWISEKDNGIYDAMNKGICYASGEWINFMNSGDRFYDLSTLGKVSLEMKKELDLVYGLDEIVFNDIKKTRSIKSLENSYIGMPFSHQSMFIKTKIHKETLYDEKYSICADYDFVCKVQKIGLNYKKLDFILVTCSAGGISDIYHFKALQQTVKIAQKHYPTKFVYWLHQKELYKGYVKAFIKMFIPNSIVNIYKQLKYEK